MGSLVRGSVSVLPGLAQGDVLYARMLPMVERDSWVGLALSQNSRRSEALMLRLVSVALVPISPKMAALTSVVPPPPLTVCQVPSPRRNLVAIPVVVVPIFVAGIRSELPGLRPGGCVACAARGGCSPPSVAVQNVGCVSGTCTQAVPRALNQCC